jgi:GntR family transcriptional regulator
MAPGKTRAKKSHDSPPRAPAANGVDGSGVLLGGEGMPLHRQLFLVIRDQINRGAFTTGQALPTEHALGEQFGVSRITVRRALQDLADQGYVRRQHGRGTFVLPRRPSIVPSPALSVLDSLRKAQLETSVEVIDLALREPPARIKSELALAEDDALYALRLRSDKTTEEPLMITEAWLPTRFSELVTRQSLARRALFEILDTAGVTMGRVVQEITAEVADPLKARLLQTSIGAPLIRINRLGYDHDAKPVQHLSLFLSPDRSRVLMDIPDRDIETAETGYIAHDVPRTFRGTSRSSDGRR